MCFNSLGVGPAQAGTHTPQRFGSIAKASFFATTNAMVVPACAGTTTALEIRLQND